LRVLEQVYYEKTAYGTVPQFNDFRNHTLVQFDLTRDTKTWQGCFESWHGFEAHQHIFPQYEIPSGETIVFLATSLQFPPLEDLYQDVFWENVLEEMKSQPNGLDFDFGIEFRMPTSPHSHGQRDHLTGQVTIKLRNPKEMAMIRAWYESTPKVLFPRLGAGSRYFIKMPQTGGNVPDPKIFGYHHWFFTATGNRYPGVPNAPETWQGWKELEESIVPSTMRDEIRLTRIMGQYYDTKDEAVLKELKEWFDGMNVVQRTVMAKSLRDRASESGSADLFMSFRDIYKTIREYDVVPIPEYMIENLKERGLLPWR
jgi:hypothetical protein